MERQYIAAARMYFAPNATLEARERNFSSAMAVLHGAYPADVDVTAFYALSLLGMTQSVDSAIPWGPHQSSTTV
jgi:hypothetical protein